MDERDQINLLDAIRNNLSHITDMYDRLTALEKRVQALESRPIPTAPYSPFPPGYPSMTAGCVCPIGAEMNCQSATCPRHHHSSPFVTT